MTLKIYLAGGFYQENDWRYEVVKGLRGAIAEAWNGYNNWTTLPKSILDCVDFVGPFPGENEIVRSRLSIKDADIVFLWVGAADDVADISKFSFELGYAAGLGKLVGVGSKFSDNEHFWDIAHAIFSASPWYTEEEFRQLIQH
jgi:nucleoside 2-deoxyribosyltransferase